MHPIIMMAGEGFAPSWLDYLWPNGARGNITRNVTNPYAVPVVLTLEPWTVGAVIFAWSMTSPITVAAGATVGIQARCNGSSLISWAGTSSITYTWAGGTVVQVVNGTAEVK